MENTKERPRFGKENALLLEVSHACWKRRGSGREGRGAVEIKGRAERKVWRLLEVVEVCGGEERVSCRSCGQCVEPR